MVDPIAVTLKAVLAAFTQTFCVDMGCTLIEAVLETVTADVLEVTVLLLGQTPLTIT